MAKQTEVKQDEVEATTGYEGISAGAEQAPVVECSTEEETPKGKGKNILATVSGAVRKGVYSSVYTVTYGVVYGSMVVAELIPTNNVVGEGMRDGLAAAKKAYHSRSGKLAAEDMNIAMGEAATAV